jgi:hypothetical protein
MPGILWTALLDIPQKCAPISITSEAMELPPEEPKEEVAWGSRHIDEGHGYARRLQGTSRQPARSVHRGHLRPWFFPGRTLCDQSD